MNIASDDVKTPAWKCKGCSAGWTFQDTGYCGPCLEKMDQVPAPLTFKEVMNEYSVIS